MTKPTRKNRGEGGKMEDGDGRAGGEAHEEEGGAGRAGGHGGGKLNHFVLFMTLSYSYSDF